MKISHARGKAFGVPANGTVVSLNDADVGTITQSASGLTKNLLTVGLVGVAAATTVGLCYLGLKTTPSTYVETRRNTGKLIFHQGDTLISSLACANTGERNFTGICMNKRIMFTSGGHSFDIPLDYVSRIYYEPPFWEFSRGTYHVHIFDESVYRTKKISIEPNDLLFFTILGKQKIKFNNFRLGGSVVFSSTIKERELFVKRLTDHLNRKSDDLVKILGKKTFEKYFYQE